MAAGWDFVFADLAALFCDFMVELSVGSWGGAIVAPAVRRALLQGRNQALQKPFKTSPTHCFKKDFHQEDRSLSMLGNSSGKRLSALLYQL
ncbi:MAG: hypothetical protein J0I01_08020 [Stenotrophomonas nitritireducens]|uniref:hypothetical protein n=1 Tax=Stenotrophomonas nitritireducens TaxID=83617 RepID=UPI001AD43486|nr:hypothetical protein [Stenotrophomonas nitritireducens]MBN8792160.1 hypothetical protein [Stenotrophomonas nitritireducens]